MLIDDAVALLNVHYEEAHSAIRIGLAMKEKNNDAFLDAQERISVIEATVRDNVIEWGTVPGRLSSGDRVDRVAIARP